MTLLVKKSLFGVHSAPIRLKVCLMEIFLVRNWNSFLIYWFRSPPQNEWFSYEIGQYTCTLGSKLDWCSFGQIRGSSGKLSHALANVCCTECLCFLLIQQRYVVVALNRASFHKAAAALRFDISRWQDKFSYLCAFIFEAIRCHKSPPMKLFMFSQIKTFLQGPSLMLPSYSYVRMAFGKSLFLHKPLKNLVAQTFPHPALVPLFPL